MVKKSITAQDMAAKLMGTAAAVTKSSDNTQMSKSSKQVEGTKRLNLNITNAQWRKLKHAALERDTTVSDLIREFIDGL